MHMPPKIIHFWRYCLQMFTKDPPDITQYDCYRRFLGDWFLAEKARNPRFSHRVFAQRAGFTSSAFLPLILQKKRNLTDRHLDGFLRALKLAPRDAVIFRALVQVGNAKDPESRRQGEAALRAARRGGARRLEVDQGRLYESWLHVAVHQALDCLEVRDDLTHLRAFLNPPPSLPELRRSLELLLKLRLVERDGAGVWKTRDANLLGDSRLDPWILRGFQEQMLDLGKTAHERFPRARTLSRTETLAVGLPAAERIRERVRLCLEEIVAIALTDPGPPAAVLQVNAQLFPLSEIPKP